MESPTPSTICDGYIDRHIERYKEQYTNALYSYSSGSPEDVVELLEAIHRLEYDRRSIESLEIEPCTFDIVGALNRYYRNQIASSEEMRTNIEENYKRDILNIQIRHTKEKERLEAEALNSVSGLSEKRSKLLEYKSEVGKVLEKYEISADDISIDPNLTIDDYAKLLDTALATCERFNVKAKHSRAEEWIDRASEAEEWVGWFTVGFTAVLYTIASPLLLGIYIYKTVSGTKEIHADIEKLKLSNYLMYDEVSRFIDKEKYAVPELDLQKLEDDKNSMLSEIPDTQKELDDAVSYAMENMPAYQERMDFEENSLRSTKEAQLKEIDRILLEYNERLEELKAKNPKFPQEVSQEEYMSHTYTVSKIGGAINTAIDLGLKNIVFEKNYNRPDMINYMKLLLSNALLNVKEKHLFIDIVDADNLGSEFVEFLSPEYKDCVNLVSTGVDNYINDLRATYVLNQAKMGNNIDEYNKECSSIGKITADYKIAVIVSSDSELEKKDSFKKFLEISAQCGIIIWWLASERRIANTIYIDSPTYGEGDPIHYDETLINDMKSVFKKAVEESKVKPIMFKDSYLEKNIPDKDWWKASTIDGINLRLGLEDGDPSKAGVLPLGDNNVHALMVGATGSGKSVVLKQIILSLMAEYSPDELSVVYVDLKNVEASLFADVNKLYSQIPHAEILSGTKDGEYCVSILKYLVDVMNERTRLFSKAGVAKLSEYREKYPDAIMPRIILIIDEFQVMFTELEMRIINQIESLIRSLSKLARFCGVHMLFTSQSMAGTIPKDIMDQFGLRIALSCSADLSTTIIGSDASAKLKTSKGFCNSNTTGGNNVDATKLWRIPLNIGSDIEYVCNKAISMCKEKGVTNRRAAYYDEQRTHKSAEIIEWRNKYPDNFKDGSIILGEMTSFRTNKAPFNILIENDDLENICIHGENKTDIYNLVLTVMDNIKSIKDVTIVANTTDKALYQDLKLPELVSPNLVELSQPSTDTAELLKSLEALVQSRLSGETVTHNPVYVFLLNYNKVQGIGIGYNMFMSDTLIRLLKTGPQANVHFVVTLRDRGEIPTNMYQQFSHKICAATEQRVSNAFVDSAKPETLLNNTDGHFAYYKVGTDLLKFKIYQYPLTLKDEVKEVFIA